MIDKIMRYFYLSLINYGLVRYPRNAGKEIFDLLLRAAGACFIIPYVFLGITNRPEMIKHVIGIFIVFLGSFAGSLIGRRFTKIGGYTLMNMLVTLAAGIVSAIIVYGVILTKGVSVSDGFGMFILIAMCAAFVPWLLGLLKSFRIRQVMGYLAADDGSETVRRSFGKRIRPGLFSNEIIVDDIGWDEKRWTAETYKYHLGLFGMSARLLIALVYGMFVGSIISIIATLPAIVRVANPGE